MRKGLRKQPKVKAAGIKINKKYTNKDNGQKTRMATEVKKFAKSKGKEAYDHQWTGDTDSKTGKAYKTKESKHTKKFKEKFGK